MSLAAVAPEFKELAARFEALATKLRGGEPVGAKSPLEDLQDLRQRLRWPPGPPPGDEEAKKEEAEPEAGGAAPSDARTLWVTWDEHGTRYKPWREVCQDMSRTEFSDWVDLFETPPVTLEIWRSFERIGGDPRRWRQNWLKEIGMSTKERTAIEVAVLTDAMFFAGTYDQLNGPSLSCMETLCLRVSQLVEAYSSGDAQRPNWGGVRHFHMASGPLNLVPKTLKSYAHRLAKEEVEIENLRIRAGCGKGVGTDVAEGGGLPPGRAKGDPPKGGGKGGDKQRVLPGGEAAAKTV